MSIENDIKDLTDKQLTEAVDEAAGEFIAAVNHQMSMKHLLKSLRSEMVNRGLKV